MSQQTSEFRSFLETAGSPRLGVALLIILAVASVPGTLILQGHQDLTDDPLKGITNFVRATLRLTDVFHSPWYLGLMAVFALNISCATIARFSLKPARLGMVASHLGVLLVLAGGGVYYVSGDKGVMVLAQGEQADAYVSRRTRQHRPLGFGVKLHAFEMDYYQAKIAFSDLDGVLTTPVEPVEGAEVTLPWQGGRVRFEKVLRNARRVERVETARPSHKATADFVGPDPAAAAVEYEVSPRRTGIDAVLVAASTSGTKERRFWLATAGGDPGMKFGDGLRVGFITRRDVSEYRSYVEFVSGKADPEKVTIRVNHPAEFGGYQFFQSDYADRMGSQISYIAVSYDPGLHMACSGLVLVVLGVFWAYLVKPALQRRRART